MIRINRIYDEVDGYRILVDRLWPRGVAKADARLDEWCRSLAPSSALRKWFHADPDGRWAEFRRRYRDELRESEDELDRLAGLAGEGKLTLLTAAKNRERNHLVVLKELLESRP